MCEPEELEEYFNDREIIAFVRSNPVLWDKKIKISRKDKNIISAAFSQIGLLLSIPLTGDAVSTRWKSLRDQYSREMRKVIASQPRSGAGSEESSYKPTWPLFNELSFLKDVIKPRKTQSNVSSKKLKSCEDTINNSSVDIVIPSITSTPKNNESVWTLESGQIEENLWNVQVKDMFKKTSTAVTEPSEDDATSECSSSMFTSVSQSLNVPSPDHFYTKKKVEEAMEKVHNIIENTAAKLNSACDMICANLTQPEHTSTTSIEEDPALALIKDFLKNVPSNVQCRCLSEIMTVLDKYSNVPFPE